MSFFPITYLVICKCLCKWRNMLCIWDKRGSSTFLICIRSSGLLLRKALKLFSLQWVLILLCSLHCVTVDHGLFSGNLSVLVPGHEVPYRVRLGAFISLRGAGAEIRSPVGCACNSFSCRGRDLLCSRITEVLQGLLLRVCPVAGVKVNADITVVRLSFVGLAGSLGCHRRRDGCCHARASQLWGMQECFWSINWAGKSLHHRLSVCLCFISCRNCIDCKKKKSIFCFNRTEIINSKWRFWKCKLVPLSCFYIAFVFLLNYFQN